MDSNPLTADTMNLSLCDADLLGVRSVGDSPGSLLGMAPLEGPGNLSGTRDATDAIAHLESLRRSYEISLASLARLVGCAQSTLVALLYPSSSRHRSVISRRLHEQLLEAEFDLDMLEPSALIGGCGTRRRLQALAVLGWSTTRLADRAGCSATEVSRWRSARSVSVGHALAVRDMYDELAMLPGPSQQARTWALGRGWQPPLAWDDDHIDDPAADANPGADVSPTPPGVTPFVDPVVRDRVVIDQAKVPDLPPEVRRAVAEEARAAGMTAAATADCLGVTLRTIQRWDAAATDPATPSRKAS